MSGDKRWRILRLHVEDQAPLAILARDTGIGLRTLQRWHHLYRERGITGLDPHPRADTGTRRTAAETVAFIERLALTRPRPALTTAHRPVAERGIDLLRHDIHPSNSKGCGIKPGALQGPYGKLSLIHI